MLVMTSTISALVASVSSTSGKRTWGDISPSRLSAYLSGTGLVSRYSAAVNFAMAPAQRWAVAAWPCRQATYILRQRPGATLEVTEMLRRRIEWAALLWTGPAKYLSKP